MKKLKIKEALKKGYEILKASKIESYIIDSQLLLQSVLNKNKVYLLTNMDKEIDNSNVERFMAMIKLRKKYMPVKYILGKCEFMGIDLNIHQGVLIPRPDTEILVSEVLEVLNAEGYTKVCDIGCGSGAIGVSLAYYNKNISVDCFDISSIALKNTEENIKLNGLCKRVNAIYSDLLSVAIENGYHYDTIVSNPPYIKEDDIDSLMKDVKEYEPHSALSGGKDGLDFYKKITKQAVHCLNPGGYLCFEIGFDEMNSVSEILRDSNFHIVKGLKDLAGLDRVIIAKGNFL